MSEASEARAVAEALIQQVPYRDKLTELIRQHSLRVREWGVLAAICECGHQGDHAEHLTKIIRGHLRQTRVVTAGPPSEHLQPCRCVDCYSRGGV